MDCKLNDTVNNNPLVGERSSPHLRVSPKAKPFGALDDPNEDSCHTVKLNLMLSNEIIYTLTIYNPFLVNVEQWKSFTATVKTNIFDSMNGDHLDIKIGMAYGKLSFASSKGDGSADNNPLALDGPNEDSCHTVKLKLMLDNEIIYTITIYNPSLVRVEQWKSFTATFKINLFDCINFGGNSAIQIFEKSTDIREQFYKQHKI